MNKKLYRNEYHKVLGGVCSGLADYFAMDVTLLRVLFVFCLFFTAGSILIAYIVLWIVLPKRGFMFNNFNNPTVDYTVPPQQPGGPFNDARQTGNPFGDNPFGGNPYGGNPYEGNPVENIPPRQKSHAGIIAGTVLILIGAFILIDNFDLIPDFDFDRLWPLILVLVGGALIVSGQKSELWHSKDWNNPEKKEGPATEDPIAKTDDTTNI